MIRSAPALPDRLVIFPLTGALLLPGGVLPLNIFEPRYLAMTDAALGEGRMIGMIQPLEGKDDAGDPPLYRTGCAGRIIEFRESGDGRYLVNLEGMSRFDVAEELPKTELFRRVRPDWSRYAGDADEIELPDFDAARLVEKLTPFLRRHRIKADLSAANSVPAVRLVDAVAMMGPFAPAEKQALLEAEPAERARLLTKLVDMALLASAGDIASARH
ncbi:MAG: LON peptidase substrate-binding domain-containing protein [Alphaproteobacteria bacterium]|nr:LON peptidase substrate-binding domain-containing protein [Alphaproteobacteria bacterium]MDE2513492.1 LON peptidase substrate-binding domain-containing protein [Alphaproteobacteria bacterium]